MSDFRLEKNPDARAVPRRIALIRRDTAARLMEDRAELRMAAPHLLIREVVLVQATVIALALISLLFDAPLEGIADPSNTPNPAKAPWYFLGLQELLHYFPPVVAGVLLPALVVIGIGVIPYFRINVESVGFYERPWKRNLAIALVIAVPIVGLLIAYRVYAVAVPTLFIVLLMALPAIPGRPTAWRARLSRVPLSDWIMTWFVAVAVVLTVIGILFRGPGWVWTWPWRGGMH